MPQTVRQKLVGPPVTRAMDASASVVDAEKGIIELSFASEIEYLRASWFDDPWIEVLGHADGECDLSRIGSGSAPLLWGHNSYSRADNIGVVVKAWIDKGRAYAHVRFSLRDEIQQLMRDVIAGIVTNVSVGYQILERTLVKQNKDAPNLYRVTKWLPLEISLVSIPADAGVGVGRSNDTANQNRWIDITEDAAMPENTTQKPEGSAADPQRSEGGAAPVITTPAAVLAGLTAEQVRAEVVTATTATIAAERERALAISDLTRAHQLGADFERSHVASGASLETVRAAALDVMATRDPATLPRMHVVVGGTDHVEKQRDAARDALLYRAGFEKPEAVQGNPYRGMSLIRLAEHCLIGRGISVSGLTPMEISARAISHSTSDFPTILQNVMHKRLQAEYNAIADTWRVFCAVGSLNDFRPHYRYRMGGFGDLAEVKEDGVYTYGTFSDAEREAITAKTKGKLLNLSRQMIINDDLGGFLNMTSKMARGAARSVEKDVYTLLASNPTLNDGGALFNSTANTTVGGHANLIAYAAPSVALFDSVRQAMGSQLDVGANDYIAVPPKIWLGPLALGGAARTINSAEFNQDVSNKSNPPNYVRNMLTTVQDTPRISGNLQYFFADPQEEPVIEVGFLNGEQSPYTEMQEAFLQDGIAWKVRLDYGVAAVGFRGAVKVFT